MACTCRRFSGSSSSKASSIRLAVALEPLTGRVNCTTGWVPHLDQNRDPSYDGT
jgi:hypothetical protein